MPVLPRFLSFTFINCHMDTEAHAYHIYLIFFSLKCSLNAQTFIDKLMKIVRKIHTFLKQNTYSFLFI